MPLRGERLAPAAAGPAGQDGGRAALLRLALLSVPGGAALHGDYRSGVRHRRRAGRGAEKLRARGRRWNRPTRARAISAQFRTASLSRFFPTGGHGRGLRLSSRSTSFFAVYVFLRGLRLSSRSTSFFAVYVFLPKRSRSTSFFPTGGVEVCEATAEQARRRVANETAPLFAVG